MAPNAPSYTDMDRYDLIREIENKQRVIDYLNAHRAELVPFKLPLRVDHIAYEGDWFYDADDNLVDADRVAEFINQRFGPHSKP